MPLDQEPPSPSSTPPTDPLPDLYVHVPFRQKPRSYDEGYTAISHTPSDESTFVTALTHELDQYDGHPISEGPIATVYVGGGRPSLLSLDAIQALCEALTSELDPSASEEVAIEVNPADTSLQYLKELRQLGVTRVSIEALSFVSDTLEVVDAPHTVDQATGAVRQARGAGVRSFSVDLLFGSSEHPLSHWKTSLHRAVELGVPHVTLHERKSAGVEDDTEDARAERFAFAMTFLQAKGYEQYQLTHFARPGHRSHHQQNYYTHGNYLGLGPSAESFWWPHRAENMTARRWSNVRDLARYVEHLSQGAAPVARRESLDHTTLAREYTLLRLRTSEGLDLDVLADRYGVDLRVHHGSLLDRLTKEGLIHDDPNCVRLTDRGRLLTDAITQRLLSE